MHTCHDNLTNHCLLNVAFSMIKALNDWSSSKQNFHSLPPSNAISKTLLLLLLVFLFFTLPFYFKLYKISTDSTPIGNLWLCGLIKYNGFQISENKFLRSKNWLHTILIRKTNLKLSILSFHVFGSSESEKIDIFLKQLNFLLLTKNFLRLLTYNKKYKNCL